MKFNAFRRKRPPNRLKSLAAALNSIILPAATAAAGPFEESSIAFDSGAYDRAASLLKPLAERGEARAQFRLGYLYESGLGVSRDYGQALLGIARRQSRATPTASTISGISTRTGSAST